MNVLQKLFALDCYVSKKILYCVVVAIEKIIISVLGIIKSLLSN